MNRNEIMKQLAVGYDFLCKTYSERHILGVFLYGSQNYHIATEDSDVDMKAIYIPSLFEIGADALRVSKEFTLPSGGHVEVKDIREMIKMWRKSNINFVEILFTEYFLINPLYEKYWKELQNKREEITRYNPAATLSAAFYLGKRYLDSFGLTYKQLANAMRLLDFCESYLAGRPYDEALVPHDPSLLIEMKEVNGKDCLVDDNYYFLLRTRENYVKLEDTIESAIITKETDYEKRSKINEWLGQCVADLLVAYYTAERATELNKALDYFEKRGE